MTFSVIIPTLNEQDNIKKVVKQFSPIKSKYNIEIIVSDSGSTDQTVDISRKYCDKIVSYPENNCNICHTKDISEWGSRGVLKLVRCNKCGLVYINPRLNEEGLTKLYSNYFLQRKNDKELSDMRKKMYSLEVEFLIKHVSKHKKILDVGCGGGSFLKSFPDFSLI